MAIKDGLRTLLLAQSSITTLAPAQTISGISFDSVFVGKAKQGAIPPYIVISRTTHDPYAALDGTTGMKQTEIDIDCFENTEPLAEALADAVNAFMKDYTGAAGGSDTIDSVLLEDIGEFVNQENGGSDVWRHAVTLTYQIQHH